MSFTESLERIVEENHNRLLSGHRDWKRVKVSEIAAIINGCPFESEKFASSRDGATPLIRIRDVLRSSTDTFYKGDFDPAYLIKNGDLLIGMDGDFNAAIWRGEPGLLNQRVCKIEPFGDSYEKRFLAYCLPGYLNAINAHTSSITVKHLSSRTIAEIPLPLPPLGEQVRISDALDELLSDLDAGVAALERVREKLKLYRASVLKAAVEGALTAEWRAQHPNTEPASELLKRILVERRRRWEEDQLAKFKERDQEPPKNWKARYKEPVVPTTTNLPTLPREWCWASFDQIGETQGGLQKSPSRAPTMRHYPYLRVANVLRGRLDLSVLHRFELTDDELNRLRLETGDVLIVEGNGSRTEIGRCALWRGEIPDCIHQNHIIRVRPLSGMHPSYVDAYLNSPLGQLAIQMVASAVTR